jgi:hypothetical protein
MQFRNMTSEFSKSRRVPIGCMCKLDGKAVEGRKLILHMQLPRGLIDSCDKIVVFNKLLRKLPPDDYKVLIFCRWSKGSTSSSTISSDAKSCLSGPTV